MGTVPVPGETPSTGQTSGGQAPEREFGEAGRRRKYAGDPGGVLSRGLGDGSFPWILAYTVTDSVLAKIDFKQFPGLLSWHTIIEDTNRVRHVYSYWINGDSLQFSKDAFVKAISGSTETVQGRLTHAKTPAKSIWKRFPFWTVVITISGVIGALAAVWEQGARLVETPDLTAVFSRDNKRNLGTADIPVISIAVTNQCRFASESVRIEATIVDDSGAVAFQPEVRRLSRIEPGVTKEFDLEAGVLRQASDTAPPKTYELKAAISARAGLWRTEKTFPISSRRFRVWSPIGWSKPYRVRTTGGGCVFRGTLYSAIARKGAATVTVAADFPIGSVVTTVGTASSFDCPESDSGQVCVQDFQIGDLEAFSEYPYSIKVNATGMTDKSCSALAARPDFINFR